MTRMVQITDSDLRELVQAAAETIRLSGTHAAHRALAQGQLLLDTMIPDADGLLGWTKGARAIRRIVETEATLHPATAVATERTQAVLRHQLEQFECDPHDYRTGLGALGAVFVASVVNGERHRDRPELRTATSDVLSRVAVAACRYAPAEVRG